MREAQLTAQVIRLDAQVAQEWFLALVLQSVVNVQLLFARVILCSQALIRNRTS